MSRIKQTIFLSYILVCSCSNFDQNINQLHNEDFYFGTPGSKLFYRTTTKETQEKYHYSECQKKINNGDQLRIESCVSSYWLKAKSL